MKTTKKTKREVDKWLNAFSKTDQEEIINWPEVKKLIEKEYRKGENLKNALKLIALYSILGGLILFLVVSLVAKIAVTDFCPLYYGISCF